METAKAAGQRWAEREREALEREGRLPEGGWPGTLTEAKAIAVSLRARSGAAQALTADELVSFTHETYAQAKRAWRDWANELHRASRRAGSSPDRDDSA
jgi:hypothetical protein